MCQNKKRKTHFHFYLFLMIKAIHMPYKRFGKFKKKKVQKEKKIPRIPPPRDNHLNILHFFPV